MKTLLLALALALGSTLSTACQAKASGPPQAAAASLPDDSPLDQVVLAGGCFWCTEAVFEALAGVEDVVSGYAGGTAESATYALVSDGVTDHAEVIQVTFDPEQIRLEQLLEVFFSVAHDPTQVDRQGPDYGRQYRSAVFYASAEQRAAVQSFIDGMSEAQTFAKPIATKLEPLEAFYPAEEYHQDFVRRNPRQGYVVQQALPKLEKLKKSFAPLLRPAAGGQP